MNDAADNRLPRPSGAIPEQLPEPGRLLAWIKRLVGSKNGSNALRDTIEELIDQEDKAATPGGEERILLRNILKLRDLSARDVMVPRADIVAVDIATPLRELVQLMSEKAHSRLPVFRETLDDATGMVHIKDLLACWDKQEPFKIADIVRRVLFVAPTMSIVELLLQMRVSRVHMALVVDEYGGIDGLVTIEDLVEEIVGEIEDEHDDDTPPTLLTKPDGTFEANARLSIDDFEAAVGPLLTPEQREEEIDTLGGLVVYLADRVPSRGEVIRHESGMELEVIDADPRRVKRVRVRNVPAPTTGK